MTHTYHIIYDKQGGIEVKTVISDDDLDVLLATYGTGLGIAMILHGGEQLLPGHTPSEKMVARRAIGTQAWCLVVRFGPMNRLRTFSGVGSSPQEALGGVYTSGVYAVFTDAHPVWHAPEDRVSRIRVRIASHEAKQKQLLLGQVRPLTGSTKVRVMKLGVRISKLKAVLKKSLASSGAVKRHWNKGALGKTAATATSNATTPSALARGVGPGLFSQKGRYAR